MHNDPTVAVGEAQARAEQAMQLLNHPLLAEAFTTLSEAYTAEWRATTPEDQQAREEAWHMLRALDKVKGHLETVAAGAQVAAYNHRRALKAFGR